MNREEYKGSIYAIFRRPIVAIVGDVDDWAVYLGEEGWSVVKTIEYGDKLPEELAAYLFPKWAEQYTYRK